MTERKTLDSYTSRTSSTSQDAPRKTSPPLSIWLTSPRGYTNIQLGGGTPICIQISIFFPLLLFTIGFIILLK
jgi:hypothetical protein